MTKKDFTTPETPELIAARARRDKLRRDAQAREESAAEQLERAELAKASLERVEKAWAAEDTAAEAALAKGAYVPTTPRDARREFREKVAAELADVRRRLGEDEQGYPTSEARSRARLNRELLQSAEATVAELEAQHANVATLAGVPELTTILREISEQLTVAGAVTHEGVTVARTTDGVVTFTVRTSAAPPAQVVDDSPLGKLKARKAAEAAAHKQSRQRIHTAMQ